MTVPVLALGSETLILTYDERKLESAEMRLFTPVTLSTKTASFSLRVFVKLEQNSVLDNVLCENTVQIYP
jgi:hypothetical protein